ncbi:MAG: bifunctional phosphopantothenoylcysteine decarboxylase/phosphopantothenate--cysteine ligase CoaBC [Thermodesulfobacteriota bacterium]
MDAHLAFTGFLGARLHLGVTGSIAAYKSLELLRMLTSSGASVGVTLTAAARQFVTPLAFSALGAEPVYTDMFGPEAAAFGHLEPGQHARALVVAPATATILAKLAHGLADDMLSCQALAFPGPVLAAPSMNPRLWEAAATRENVAALLRRGVRIIGPGCGAMACGDTGEGRLADLRQIALEALRAVTPQDMAGRRVLVSLGPTQEPWDCVRIWTNRSTGTMGAALAVAAWLRGAEVTAVCGPVSLWLPQGVRRVDTVTARDMFEACTAAWPDTDLGCMTAAVCDFAPEPFGPDKFKKTPGEEHGPTLSLVSNPDILAHLGAHKRPGQRLIGFAAESRDLEANARGKMARKNLDLIVANPVNEPGCGFGSAENRALVLDAAGRSEEWPTLAKTEMAWRIWEWMLHLCV